MQEAGHQEAAPVTPAVAVIAWEPGATLDACLAALRGQGAEPGVFAVGPDGAGQARNRALAACTADVLALVEDDVVVGPGWLAALQRAWSQAAGDVAVIGGPLVPRFAAGRPGWLDPALDGALAVQHLGASALALDLADRTFHGGNVSFRAAALRGAGGFWPARGHRHGRDWFSDEHHAQQALGVAGWGARYEPAVHAERVAAPRPGAVLLGRARYGARMAALGGDGARPRDEAARSALRAAAGLPVALAQRRGSAALSRAARLAENTGVLTGARIAERDFQPTVRRTPFRPSVPLASRRVGRRHAGTSAHVLLYHRIGDLEHDPLRQAISPANFARQLEVLGERRRVVDLEELARRARSNDLDPACVAVTFDDGYADNARAAAPALAAHDMPWTLFVSTGHVEEHRAFWWDEVIELLDQAPATRPPELRIAIGGAPRAWRVGDAAERESAARALLPALQALAPAEIDDALDALRAWAGIAPEPPARDRPMTVEELRDLARGGVTIGAHTRTHRGLAYAPEADQREEIAASRDDIERWLGQAPSAFSYPFGSPGADVDEVAMGLVREAGFDCAVVTAPGAVTRHSDPYALPRVVVPDLGADGFAGWLAAR